MMKVINKLFGTVKRAVISLLCIVIISAGLGAVVYAVCSRDTVQSEADTEVAVDRAVQSESSAEAAENDEVQLESSAAQQEAAVDSATVSLEDAKSIVLADAGVADSDVTFTKAKQKTSHGEEIYDLEFYTDTYEYEYEVLVADGSIVEVDMDARKVTAVQTIPETTVTETTAETQTTTAAETVTETTTTAETSTAADSYISVDEAKNIAVSAAGLSISDVIFEKAKLDKEHGVRVYEIEFYQGRTEYEYVINATTGEIVEYDIDYD